MAEKHKEELVEKGFAFLLSANFILLVTGYLTSLGLARLFSPEQLGVYGVVMAVIAIITELLVTGMQNSVSKFVSETPGNSGTVFRKALKLQFFIGLFFTLALFLSADLLAGLLNDQSLAFFFRLASIILLFRALSSVFLGLFNGLKKFKKQAFLNAFFSVAKIVLILGLVFLGFSVFGAIVGFLAASVLLVVSGFLVLGKIPTKQKAREFSTKALFFFSVPLLFFNLFNSILPNIDLLLIKALSPANVSSLLSGYYTVAIYLARIPEVIAVALIAVLFPLISFHTFVKNEKKTSFYIHRSLRYSLMVLLPVAGLISSSAVAFVGLFSDKYAPAGFSVSILAFGSLFFSFFLIFSTIIAASGKPKKAFAFSALVIAISAVLNFLLIPILSIEGAAIASTVAAFIGLVVSGASVFLEFKTLTSIKSVARIFFASLVVFVLSCFFQTTGVLSLVLKCVILGLAYVLILWAIREFKKEDFEVLKNMAR